MAECWWHTVSFYLGGRSVYALDSMLPSNTSAQATGVSGAGDVSGFYVDRGGINHGISHFGFAYLNYDEQGNPSGRKGDVRVRFARRVEKTMSLIQIDAVEGRSKEEIRNLLDATHRAVLSAFKVPQRDNTVNLTLSSRTPD